MSARRWRRCGRAARVRPSASPRDCGSPAATRGRGPAWWPAGRGFPRDAALADEIILRLDRLGLAAPRLLHGEDASCWPLIAHAGRLGLATRIGLEDTLVTDDGRPAADNAALVRRALRVWEAQCPRR